MKSLILTLLIFGPLVSSGFLIDDYEIDNEYEINVILFATESELLEKYPHAKNLELKKEELFTGRVQLTYTLGNRVPGDQLVAIGTDSYSWPDARDVKLELTYPTSENGAVVSYLRIGIVQDTNIGNAYVVSGGIGQRRIVIAVQAVHTTFLSYNAQIYGR
ncbi:uncharacterized protein LOC113368098 [Ctenocephalides felis]|uniref:uncharacterized protein LOC113368098 n=1 Tax=Ctenocephalides felis TaxID=7515 RepID=UPI000E6E3F16|nr:uncharacterized protein LOC113368098 [Ctenocephalides felis]